MRRGYNLPRVAAISQDHISIDSERRVSGICYWAVNATKEEMLVTNRLLKLLRLLFFNLLKSNEVDAFRCEGGDSGEEEG